jgi:hypothetical protein
MTTQPSQLAVASFASTIPAVAGAWCARSRIAVCLARICKISLKSHFSALQATGARTVCIAKVAELAFSTLPFGNFVF